MGDRYSCRIDITRADGGTAEIFYSDEQEAEETYEDYVNDYDKDEPNPYVSITLVKVDWIARRDEEIRSESFE